MGSLKSLQPNYISRAVSYDTVMKAPPFPYAGVICFSMAGLLLISGGFSFGKYMLGFAILWAAIALFLKMRSKSSIR